MAPIPIRSRFRDKVRDKWRATTSSRDRSSSSTPSQIVPPATTPATNAPSIDASPSITVNNPAPEAIQQPSTLSASITQTQPTSLPTELSPINSNPNQAVSPETSQPSLPPALNVPSDPQLCHDLWGEAFQNLNPKDQSAIQALRLNSGTQSPQGPLFKSIEEILNYTQNIQTTSKGKSFKFRFAGKEIIARDVVGKIVQWLKRFKEIGDVAVSFDPVHAALPWAGFRFLLQVAIAENEQTGELLLAVEKLSCVISRGTIYQKLYQPGVIKTNAVEKLRRSMVKLYEVVLQIMALCHRLFSKHPAARILHATTNPGEVSGYLDRCRQLENDVERDAHNCEGERSQEADTECKRLLELLWTPIVRIDEGVLRLLVKVEKAERLKILDWTSKVLYGSNHQLVKEERTDGTCEWLLDHDSYREWKSESSSNILWLYGTAGTGKTFLTSKVIDDIQTTLASQPNQEGFAFFYCNRNEAERRQPISVLRAFVRQLSTIAGDDASIQSKFKDYVEKSRLQASVPTIGECKNLIMEFINVYPRTTLVLDALDECDNLTRSVLIKAFEGIVTEASNPVKILISSRPDGDITEKLKNRANIGIDATHNDRDISKFINSEIVQHRQWDNFPSDLKVEIVETLQKRSQGMFQWAFLQIKELLKLQLQTSVRSRLGKLPEDLKTAYDEIFYGIPDDQKTIAHRAFQWVMCARTPLTTKVILPAICQDGSQILAPLDGFNETMALEFCHNLLVIDPVRQVWIPSHLSVIEYFETHIWTQSKANCLVARVCLSVLQNTLLYKREACWRVAIREIEDDSDSETETLYSMEIGKSDVDDPLSENGFEYLSFYVRRHWPLHTQSISDISDIKIISPLLEEFLGMPTNSSATYRMWHRMVQADEAEEEIPSTYFFKPFIVRPNMLAPESVACLGFCAFALDNLLPDWHSFSWVNENLTSDKENTLLQLAVMSRSVRTCRELIAHGADVNAHTQIGIRDWGIEETFGSALNTAIADNQLDLVKFLVVEARTDVNLQVRNLTKGSALVIAATSGQKDVVEFLIEKGEAIVDMQVENGWYGSALVAAAASGHKAIVEYLLKQREVNVNLQVLNGYCGNALIAASVRGNLEVVKFLVEAGADVNIQASSGRYGSALIATSVRGNLEVVKFLVEAGADVKIQATSGESGSALIAASESGELEVVKFLVEAGADVNIQASSGHYGSALIAASERGALEVVKFLVEAGADVKMRTEVGKFPTVLMAAKNCTEWGVSEPEMDELVQFLKNHGAEDEAD